MNKRIAAFVMTYERSEILLSTIQKLFEQSLPPEKVLIVDNSESLSVQERVQDLDPRIIYYRVGYNSGPAGAAGIGLATLAQEGFKWVFWGDDDDPPPTIDCFEKLISLAESYQGNCGQVGLVGHRLNRYTGLLKRTPNEVLYKNKYVEVDTIGGNKCKIINAQVVLDGVLPEEKLFFGHEELDFDLSLKRAGYKTIVHCDLFLKCREMSGRMNYSRQVGLKRKESVIWREYYSCRNFLYISKKNNYYLAFCFMFFRILAKCTISYGYGLRYGTAVSKNIFNAIADFCRSKFYQRSVAIPILIFISQYLQVYSSYKL